jgi:hypothetical protein
MKVAAYFALGLCRIRQYYCFFSNFAGEYVSNLVFSVLSVNTSSKTLLFVEF